MAQTLKVPPISYGRETHGSDPQRRVSTTRSWISSLAAPLTSPDQDDPIPPVPRLPISIQITGSSPDSTARTIKLSHIPPSLQPGKEPGKETDTDSQETDTTTDEVKGTQEFLKMSTVEEVSEQVTSPSGTRKSKARSFVGGFVNSLRGLPHAMTHSQYHDRHSTVRESSVSGVTSRRTTVDYEHQHQQPGTGLRFPALPMPLWFGPNGPQPYPLVQSPEPLSTLRTSKWDSEYGSERETRSRQGTLGGFIGELTSLPWISANRIAVDYIPGSSSTRSVPSKTSTSWYSLAAPGTPSVFSHPERFVPDPWFPPPQLTPAVEVPGEEEKAEADESREALLAKVEQLKSELQEKTREVTELRQQTEHQKVTIGKIEMEMQELNRDLAQLRHRRRNSTSSSVRSGRSVAAPILAVRNSSVRASKRISYLD